MLIYLILIPIYSLLNRFYGTGAHQHGFKYNKFINIMAMSLVASFSCFFIGHIDSLLEMALCLLGTTFGFLLIRQWVSTGEFFMDGVTYDRYIKAGFLSKPILKIAYFIFELTIPSGLRFVSEQRASQNSNKIAIIATFVKYQLVSLPLIAVIIAVTDNSWWMLFMSTHLALLKVASNYIAFREFKHDGNKAINLFEYLGGAALGLTIFLTIGI